MSVDDYWTDLCPEKAFLARVFVDHCVAAKDAIRLEAALPVVTLLAFKIQEAYNDLNAFLADQNMDDFLKDGIEDEEEEERKQMVEEERTDREFVIGEMLKLAVNLDYADEIGRRKMFQLVSEYLVSDETRGCCQYFHSCRGHDLRRRPTGVASEQVLGCSTSTFS